MMPWTKRNFARGGLRRWLAATGSLSARLAATGTVFSVQVLSQGREPLTRSESRALGLAGPSAGHVREVLLKVDGQTRVFARSVTTQRDSLGAWRAVRGLGSRPLADVLFTRAGISRQALQYQRIQPRSALSRRVGRSWQLAQSASQSQAAASLDPPAAPSAALPRSLPARRSVFLRQGAALLVMEVFVAPDAVRDWPGQSGQKNLKPGARA
jgi:chorismate--pyruvate lyase